MAKQLFNAVIHTGTQVFSDITEYFSFLNELDTQDSPLAQIKQHQQTLVTNGDIISQNHQKVIFNDSELISSGKIFASEEAAASYQAWLTEGEGKTLANQLMQPLNWSFVDIHFRPLQPDEYVTIMSNVN